MSKESETNGLRLKTDLCFCCVGNQLTWVKYALLPFRKESTSVSYKSIHLTVFIGKWIVNIQHSSVTSLHLTN